MKPTSGYQKATPDSIAADQLVFVVIFICVALVVVFT